MPINTDEYSYEDEDIVNIENAIRNNFITTDADLDEETRKAFETEFEQSLSSFDNTLPKKKRGRKPKDYKPIEDDDIGDVKIFIPSSYKNNYNATATMNYLKTHPDPIYNPLSVQEEIDILTEWLPKDIEHLKYLLFCHHIKLVYSLAGKHYKHTNEFDDMVSRGYEGLRHALNHFDFSRSLIAKKLPKGVSKIKFSTYATFWINKYIIWEFYNDALNVAQKNISLDKVASDGGESGVENSSGTALDNYITTKLDTVNYRSPVKSVMTQVSCNFANEVIQHIYSYIENDNKSEFEKYDYEIFYRIFNENDSVKNISSDMNLSVSYVNKRKSDILNKVRNMLSYKYGINSIDDIF